MEPAIANARASKLEVFIDERISPYSEPAGWLSGIVTFFAVWGYAVATYGWFLGLALGWIPALCVAALVGVLLWIMLPSLVSLLLRFLPYYIPAFLLFVCIPLMRDGEIGKAGRFVALGLPALLVLILVCLLVKREAVIWWQSREPRI